jgi:hypothetical protein
VTTLGVVYQRVGQWLGAGVDDRQAVVFLVEGEHHPALLAVDGAGENVAGHAQAHGVGIGLLGAQFGESDVVGLTFFVSAEAQPVVFPFIPPLFPKVMAKKSI